MMFGHLANVTGFTREEMRAELLNSTFGHMTSSSDAAELLVEMTIARYSDLEFPNMKERSAEEIHLHHYTDIRGNNYPYLTQAG